MGAFALGPGGLYVRVAAAGRPADPSPERNPLLPDSGVDPGLPGSGPGPVPVPVPTPAAASPGDDAEMLRATRAQARATWLGALVALAALVVSALAWSGQQNVNRQQQRLNDYLLLREERVYASRVAVWAVQAQQDSSVLSAGLDVVMQNRAPVPIRRLRISAWITTDDLHPPVRGAIDLGELEPCQMVSFRLSPPTGTTFLPTGDGWLGYTGLSVDFSEADRAWRLTSSSLTLQTGAQPPDLATAALVIPRSRTATPIGDCGESS
ncbi:hypothetical protein [Catenuloplanes japonicus]|uniref:hypothetical protein n=1 Tax=Catenuloplanes japonicus TaxID=33876 RepID=UPI0005279849|nr:hypothetical protein [Catenuloplanes japonicus]